MKRNTSLPWLAAVAMSVAALTATPAAASAVIDYPEDQLVFASVSAQRYEGDQPVDLFAELLDIEGAPVEGAAITVEINTSSSAQLRKVQLEEKGRGLYIACDAAYMQGSSGEDVYVFTATKNRMHPAQEKVQSKRGNMCGEGEPQIHIASVQAAKVDGPNKPLSVLVELVDDGGNPVHDAKVRVRATNFEHYRDVNVSETSSGKYSDCNVALFSTDGPGEIVIMVQASADGYRSAYAWGENTVGYLCTTTVQQPATARRTR
jgi:hypothetical protein